MKKDKQRTIGISPLEEYLSPEFKEEASEAKPEEIKRQRITMHVSVDIINRVKNVVFWQPGLTMADFAEAAFEKLLIELEEERGEAFPQRKEFNLRGGRPIK